MDIKLAISVAILFFGNLLSAEGITKLDEINVEQLKQWIEEEQFAPGSMLPKIEAAINFVENRPDGKVVITSLENVNNFFEGGSATVVSNE